MKFLNYPLILYNIVLPFFNLILDKIQRFSLISNENPKLSINIEFIILKIFKNTFL